MQWVIKFLTTRLKQEQDIADFHGSIASEGRKYAESARMARERIPQLKQALEILKSNQQPILRTNPLPRRGKGEANQLSMF